MGMQSSHEHNQAGMVKLSRATLTVTIVCERNRCVFRLSEPVRLYVLAVSDTDGRIVWKISPSAFHRNEIVASRFFSVEMESIPDWVQRGIKDKSANPTADVPLLESIVYGMVPEGYKQSSPARPLEPATEYYVIAMGERDATASFTTPE